MGSYLFSVSLESSLERLKQKRGKQLQKTGLINQKTFNNTSSSKSTCQLNDKTMKMPMTHVCPCISLRFTGQTPIFIASDDYVLGLN